MLRSPALLLFACTACVLLGQSVGCDSVGKAVGGDGSGSGATMIDITESVLGDWTLAGINGSDLAAMAADRVPTLTIGESGTASGFTGVNRWTSSLDLDALTSGVFDLGPTATTRMAGPPAAMDLENRFVTALNSVTGFDAGALSDGVLRLVGSDGGELLRFVRGG